MRESNRKGKRLPYVSNKQALTARCAHRRSSVVQYFTSHVFCLWSSDYWTIEHKVFREVYVSYSVKLTIFMALWCDSASHLNKPTTATLVYAVTLSKCQFKSHYLSINIHIRLFVFTDIL